MATFRHYILQWRTYRHYKKILYLVFLALIVIANYLWESYNHHSYETTVLFNRASTTAASIYPTSSSPTPPAGHAAFHSDEEENDNGKQFLYNGEGRVGAAEYRRQQRRHSRESPLSSSFILMAEAAEMDAAAARRGNGDAPNFSIDAGNVPFDGADFLDSLSDSNVGKYTHPTSSKNINNNNHNPGNEDPYGTDGSSNTIQQEKASMHNASNDAADIHKENVVIEEVVITSDDPYAANRRKFEEEEEYDEDNEDEEEEEQENTIDDEGEHEQDDEKRNHVNKRRRRPSANRFYRKTGEGRYVVRTTAEEHERNTHWSSSTDRTAGEDTNPIFSSHRKTRKEASHEESDTPSEKHGVSEVEKDFTHNKQKDVDSGGNNYNKLKQVYYRYYNYYKRRKKRHPNEEIPSSGSDDDISEEDQESQDSRTKSRRSWIKALKNKSFSFRSAAAGTNGEVDSDKNEYDVHIGKERHSNDEENSGENKTAEDGDDSTNSKKKRDTFSSLYYPTLRSLTRQLIYSYQRKQRDLDAEDENEMRKSNLTGKNEIPSDDTPEQKEDDRSTNSTLYQRNATKATPRDTPRVNPINDTSKRKFHADLRRFRGGLYEPQVEHGLLPRETDAEGTHYNGQAPQTDSAQNHTETVSKRSKPAGEDRRNPLGWVPCLHFLPIYPVEVALQYIQQENEDDALLALFYAPDLFPQYNYVQWLRYFALLSYGLYKEQELHDRESGFIPRESNSGSVELDEEQAEQCDKYFRYVSPLASSHLNATSKAGNSSDSSSAKGGKDGPFFGPRRRALLERNTRVAVIDAYFPRLDFLSKKNKTQFLSSQYEFFQIIDSDTYHIENYSSLAWASQNMSALIEEFFENTNKTKLRGEALERIADVKETNKEDVRRFHHKKLQIENDRLDESMFIPDTVDTHISFKEYSFRRNLLLKLIGLEGSRLSVIRRALDEYDREQDLFGKKESASSDAVTKRDRSSYHDDARERTHAHHKDGNAADRPRREKEHIAEGTVYLQKLQNRHPLRSHTFTLNQLELIARHLYSAFDVNSPFTFLRSLEKFYADLREREGLLVRSFFDKDQTLKYRLHRNVSFLRRDGFSSEYLSDVNYIGAVNPNMSKAFLSSSSLSSMSVTDKSSTTTPAGERETEHGPTHGEQDPAADSDGSSNQKMMNKVAHPHTDKFSRRVEVDPDDDADSAVRRLSFYRQIDQRHVVEDLAGFSDIEVEKKPTVVQIPGSTNRNRRKRTTNATGAPGSDTRYGSPPSSDDPAQSSKEDEPEYDGDDGLQLEEGGDITVTHNGQRMSCVPLESISYFPEDDPDPDMKEEPFTNTLHFCGGSTARNYLLRQNPPCLFFPQKQGSRPFFFPQTFLKLMWPHFESVENGGSEENDDLDAFTDADNLGDHAPAGASTNADEEEAVKRNTSRLLRRRAPPPPNASNSSYINRKILNRSLTTEALVRRLSPERNLFTTVATEVFNYDEVIEAPSSIYAMVVLLANEAVRASDPKVQEARKKRWELYALSRILWEQNFAREFLKKHAATTLESLLHFHLHPMPHHSGSSKNETLFTPYDLNEYYFRHDGLQRVDPDRFIESAPLQLHFFLRLPYHFVEAELLQPLRQRLTDLRRQVQEIILRDIERYADPSIFERETLRVYPKSHGGHSSGDTPSFTSERTEEEGPSPSYAAYVANHPTDISLGDVQAKIAWTILLYQPQRRPRTLFGLLSPSPPSTRRSNLDKNVFQAEGSAGSNCSCRRAPALFSFYESQAAPQVAAPVEAEQEEKAVNCSACEPKEKDADVLNKEEVEEDIKSIQERNRKICLYLFHNSTAEYYIRRLPLNIKRYNIYQRLQEANRLALQAKLVLQQATEEDRTRYYVETLFQDGIRRHRALQDLHFYQEVEKIEREKRRQQEEEEMGPEAPIFTSKDTTVGSSEGNYSRGTCTDPSKASSTSHGKEDIPPAEHRVTFDHDYDNLHKIPTSAQREGGKSIGGLNGESKRFGKNSHEAYRYGSGTADARDGNNEEGAGTEDRNEDAFVGLSRPARTAADRLAVRQLHCIKKLKTQIKKKFNIIKELKQENTKLGKTTRVKKEEGTSSTATASSRHQRRALKEETELVKMLRFVYEYLNEDDDNNHTSSSSATSTSTTSVSTHSKRQKNFTILGVDATEVGEAFIILANVFRKITESHVLTMPHYDYIREEMGEEDEERDRDKPMKDHSTFSTTVTLNRLNQTATAGETVQASGTSTSVNTQKHSSTEDHFKVHNENYDKDDEYDEEDDCWILLRPADAMREEELRREKEENRLLWGDTRTNITFPSPSTQEKNKRVG